MAPIRPKSQLKKLWRFIQRENIDRLLLVLTLLVLFSSIGLTLTEPDLSLLDSLWWSVVTLTTVGYGDIAPSTLIGRVIAIINMVIGIGVLAIFSATLASILVDRKIKEELGMSNYHFEQHIILCEWNHRAASIIRELRLDPQSTQTPIVLVADIERKPIDSENLYFIRGQVSDETLNRANLSHASTVIILGDDHLEETARDAKSILSTLTIESINPHTYTIVEIVNQTHAITCRRAQANEVIVSSNLSSMLISQATLNHGISEVISELLSFQIGNQLYKIPLPHSKINQPFIDVFIYMKQTYQSIVVGMQKGKEGKVISNPDTNEILEQGDYLIIIATENPQQQAKLQSENSNI